MAQLERNTSSYEDILKQKAGSQKSNTFKTTYSAFIILAIMIALSFYVRSITRNIVQSDSKVAFEKVTNSVASRVSDKYNSNLHVLTSTAGLYDRYVEVVRDYFKLYSKVPTSSDPSIKSLMYVSPVKKSYLSEYIFNMQRQGLFDYKIHPMQDKQLYYPVEYIEPQETLEANAGFDFASDKTLLDAIELARDSNRVVATFTSVTLNNGEEQGFYLIAPVYKNNMPHGTSAERKSNFSGVVVEEINVNEFFKDALAGNFPADKTILFKFNEVGKNQSSRIYSSANYNKFINQDYSRLEEEIELKVADKKFVGSFYTVPTFNSKMTANLHNITFIIALLLSFALFGFIYSVMTGKVRAEHLAEKMTRSQRMITENAKDIISVIGFDGKWKSLNPAAETVFGTDRNRMINDNFNNYLSNETDKNDFSGKVKKAESEDDTVRRDYQMKFADGSLRWVSWNFSVSEEDQLIYAIGRDITLEKQAEEQAILQAKQTLLAEQYAREASEFKSFFMRKLSHQMRNSLTGILGYLQLLDLKAYENEEEQESYIKSAEDSGNELFSFLSDIVEVASTGEGSDKANIETLHINDILNNVKKNFEKDNKDLKFKMKINENATEGGAKVIADHNVVSKALNNIFTAVSQGSGELDIEVEATENPYEGATEIQMMTNGNPLVSKIIDIYKSNDKNIIQNLKKDKKDIMLNLAIAASLIKMMNGTMIVDTLGENEGNVVQIVLPFNKKS